MLAFYATIINLPTRGYDYYLHKKEQEQEQKN
jgi:hypothetical protein